MQGRALVSAQEWARAQFDQVQLGDQRRTRRAVVIAAGIALRPQGSIPMQAQTPAGVKAAYRFFDEEDVTFEALTAPHVELTRRAAAGREVVLMLQDSSDLSFTGRGEIDGLGPLSGHAHAKGLILHSVLAVSDGPEPAVLGLAHQELWARIPAPKGETDHQRQQRPRQSQVWARGVAKAGACGPAKVIHVCDREADLFELFEACVQEGVGYVVRVGGRDRRVRPGHEGGDSGADGSEAALTTLARAAAPCGSTPLELRKRPGVQARTAALSVSAQPLTVMPPRLRDRRRTKGVAPIRAWLVRVWEAAPPASVEPVEWLLLTGEPVNDAAGALRVAGWYAKRWLLEEYHKCLKTGCAAESRQLTSAARLKPLIGMLAVVATRLLALKLASRHTPDRPAEEVVGAEHVRVLAAYRGGCSPQRADTPRVEKPTGCTCRQFWRSVAQLGGFLGRKGDGDPGWITLWRGWQQLDLLVAGARLASQIEKRCGE